ncbi:Complement C1q-like protein 4 [Mizuhopecten yessoensis]|uniref:Complement C1q-like protein 4 n=2 Tax=Mizuhopecten yessoensis TaxID=6573 RepID=A0A210R0N9_MIZYE|nr:Complement C1q-like protein 4 [Mizuhopecten yessoensis]
MSPTLVNLANQFNDLKNTVKYFEASRIKFTEELSERVTDLERERAADVRCVDKSLTDLKHLHDKDRQTILNLTETVQSLKSENMALMTMLNDEVPPAQEDSPYSSRVVRGVQTAYDYVNTRTGSSEGTVAFHVLLTRPLLNPGLHQTIVFDKITTNVGAQISNNTGVFSCNQPGVYVFSWQVLLQGSQYMISELTKNGMRVGSQEIGNTQNTVSGSSTAVVELDNGDEVWVSIAAHSQGSGVEPHLTMFAGFRLP